MCQSSESSNSLPILSPEPNDLQLLGEGNDHLVFALKHQDKVLRIRKINPNEYLTSETLLKRAQIDLSFQHDIADELFGYLFTDRSSTIVILDPIKHEAIMNSIEDQRQTSRKTKLINPFGISILCENACVAFTDRTCVLNEELNCDKSLSGLNNETKYSIDKKENISPDQFISSKKICIELKPKQAFSEVSLEGQNFCKFCIKQHLKIKSGKESRRSFFCPLDLFSGNESRMKKSLNNLFITPKSNLKIFQDGILINGDISKYSYVKDVILAAITFQIEPEDDIILNKSDANFCKQSENEEEMKDLIYSPGSLLGKLMTLQRFDNLGCIAACQLYNILKNRCSISNQDINSILSDVPKWKTNLKSMKKLLKNIVTNIYYKIDDKDLLFSIDVTSNPSSKINCRRTRHVCKENNPKNGDQLKLKENDREYLNGLTDDNNIKTIIEKTELLKVDEYVNPLLDLNELILSNDDIIKKLQEYLVAMTTKDVSIMILIDGPHLNPPEILPPRGSSPFWINIPNDVWYKCQITAVDLIAKPPKKIVEHVLMFEKMENMLQTLLNTNTKMPRCCSSNSYEKF